MPVMDGHQFLDEIRADPALALIPLILLSAKTQIDSRISGLDAGADD